MNPNLVERELREAFDDWDGLLVNPRFCRNGDLISWTGFDGGKVKEPVTVEKVLALLNQRQFTFQCAEDGSVFQILYRFDADGLTEARLGFYLVKGRGSLEEGNAEIRSIAWIRFDFDRDSANGILHSACHLHLHGFPGTRVVVDGVPSPRQFIEFVVSACYPDYYRVNRLNDQDEPDSPAQLDEINSRGLPATETRSPYVLHVALPPHGSGRR